MLYITTNVDEVAKRIKSYTEPCHRKTIIKNQPNQGENTTQVIKEDRMCGKIENLA